MSSKVEQTLLIFSKSPLLGTTKTRLQPILTEQQCLSFHLALLQDTILLAKQVDQTPILYFSDPFDSSFSFDLDVRIQKGKDLGERMYRVFAEELQKSSRVIIIGTDSPMMDAAQIRKAFESLKCQELVLGPAQDGGYYLIGLSTLIPEIFEGIAWGTSGVLAETLKAAAGRSSELLEPGWDIDVPEDLFRLERVLLNNPQLGLPNTRRWMIQWKQS